MDGSLTYTERMTIIDCITCGMPFAFTHGFEQVRRSDHKSFYCPRGHTQYYPQKTKEEELQARLERESSRRIHAQDQLEATERSRRALKGQLTKLRNRIANGVCPWCHRSFPNVLAHVTTEHPEHRAQAEEATA